MVLLFIVVDTHCIAYLQQCAYLPLVFRMEVFGYFFFEIS